MMREKWLISMLTQLEKEQPLTVIEETRLLDMLKRSVTDAITLYNEIAQN
jgi:hypothetical protein